MLGSMPLSRVPQVIEGPARRTGLRVEDEFVRQAAHDAETEDALPLLAFTLRQLFDQSAKDQSKERCLTLQAYKVLGDEEAGLGPLENAVRKAADTVLDEANATDEEKTALREAFVPAMVRVNEQGEYVRRPARMDALPAKSNPLLERLAKAKARLLIIRQGGTPGSSRWRTRRCCANGLGSRSGSMRSGCSSSASSSSSRICATGKPRLTRTRPTRF